LTALLAYAIALGIPALAFYLINALDLFKTSKTQTVVQCALWGALVAYPLAALINGEMHSLLGYIVVVNLTAPLVEEILKALILLYFTRQPSFHYFVDGAVYGFGVGIGFAIIENVAYVSATPSLGLAITRVLSTSLMHAMASGIVGLSLGRLRRTQMRILPLLGIGGAVALHIIYNNIVNMLTGPALLIAAVTIGVGGAGAIALQIIHALRREKEQFNQTLSLENGVSPGERQAIQQFGGASIEAILQQLGKTFGEENILLIRRLLITEANIGILENNLTSFNVSQRLRTAWESEVAARQAESRELRQQMGRSVLAYLSTLFPAQDGALWTYLEEQFASYDPTMVHTFDMFMRFTELAQKFTPEQLEARAERLSRIDIFRNISLADLENLSRAIEVAHFGNGEMLFDKGDQGDAMYLIEQGAIDVYALDHGHREKHLRTFGVGQVVGDFAVLDGEERSARARAQGDLSVLVLRREVFQMFIQSRPQVILAVLAVLAERARYTTRTVEAMIQTLSSIAQGDYTYAIPAAPPAEISLTEIPAVERSLLERELAKFTSRLQARERALS
jgi:RsiW-degrading membrane proteinase PrsW (M82 family)/CRP-like cAMP-binding protein